MRVRRDGAVKSAVWFTVAVWTVLAGSHDSAYAQAAGMGAPPSKVEIIIKDRQHGYETAGFTMPSQAVQILPLFFAAHLVSLLVRMIAGGMFPGWDLLLAPVLEALLWPLVTWVLLAPQRRPPDPDENRPL